MPRKQLQYKSTSRFNKSGGAGREKCRKIEFLGADRDKKALWCPVI